MKKIFCKHKFNYFHRNTYVEILTSIRYYKYHFVCEKCGKESVLYEQTIDNYSRKFSKQVAKEKAMGIDNSQYEDYKFILESATYSGKLAYYMEKEFGKYKQDKAIPYYS